ACICATVISLNEVACARAGEDAAIIAAAASAPATIERGKTRRPTPMDSLRDMSKCLHAWAGSCVDTNLSRPPSAPGELIERFCKEGEGTPSPELASAVLIRPPKSC